MNKIYNQYFDETYYNEKLDNGLEVIIFHKPAFINTTACFGTPYGALKIFQKTKEKEYSFNPGVAHFLEHKLFESEGKDILNKFSELGANVNAFTSYKETVYYFSKTGEDIDDSLNLLLDFVQSLDITKESVEKEKGIICEELMMYKQNPDNELINGAFKSLYKYYPLNKDIGGEPEDVKKITLDELYTCYNLNYHPSNMVLLVVTPLDPEHIIQLIRNNQNNKKFIKQDRPTSNNKLEPTEVFNKELILKMPVNKDKICYAIKLKPIFKDNLDAHKKEIALKMYLSAYFSKRNPDYQKWMDEGIINDYFDYEVDFDEEYALILFYNESENPFEFKKLIDDELKKDLLTKEMVDEQKRKLIGSSFKDFDDVESFALGYIRSYLEGIDFFEDIKNLKDLDYDFIINTYKSFDYSNYALIHIVNNK